MRNEEDWRANKRSLKKIIEIKINSILDLNYEFGWVVVIDNI
jgi:hypothetical protein